MSRAIVHAICSALPGAELSDPWGGGHDAWKIGGKMFACVGTQDQGVAVKTSGVEFAAMLIDAGVARRARYFHRSWVMIPWGGDPDLIRERIEISYDIIRASLTKKLQSSLAPRR